LRGVTSTFTVVRPGLGERSLVRIIIVAVIDKRTAADCERGIWYDASFVL